MYFRFFGSGMPHMSRVIEADFDQALLLPPCLEDWVGPEHPARFIREFVAAMDLDALGICWGSVGLEGQPHYGARLLLRLWLYGYYEKIRSSRALERACRTRLRLDKTTTWVQAVHLQRTSKRADPMVPAMHHLQPAAPVRALAPTKTPVQQSGTVQNAPNKLPSAREPTAETQSRECFTLPRKTKL